MEAHGGSIRVEAGTSGGSVFVLTLPLTVEDEGVLVQPGAQTEEPRD